MNVALVVGTMILGSWVLSSPDEDQGAPDARFRSSQSGAARSSAGATAGSTPDAAAGSVRRRGAAARVQPQAAVMPLAPTESGTPEEGMLLPDQPTGTSSGQMGGGAAGMMDRPSGPRHPMAPTARRSGYAGGRTTGSASLMLNQGGRLPPSIGTAAYMAPPPAEKAFSSYRTPSGVSPYMNLFRTGTHGGVIDNYTSLVRPEIEQRYLNQQLGYEIRGLERSTRTQGMNLQQLNREARSLQGVATPQFYMNRGSYFPDAGQ